jgi:oxygen-independent coproporphyrinogen-3 oxidase
MLLTSILRILLTRSSKPFIFRKNYSDHLSYLNLKNLGLYVHIPFCSALCDFCPYFKIKYDETIALEYTNALIREIDIVCYGQKEKKAVTSLYFGGGTPALVLPGLQKIIFKLEEYFYIKDGIGVELHPDDICENTLNVLKAAGVNMISIGVQSFDDGCLNALGRENGCFAQKIELVRAYRFSVIDVDLIFGIPGQTETGLINDIESAFKCGATQVSTYPFIDFTFANNMYKPMPEKNKKKMLSAIAEYAVMNDIERTSVWTFAKKGTGKYSSVTRENFLGFGASAATLSEDTFKINTFSISDYMLRVNENHLPTSLALEFSKRQRACYFLFWACYSMRINTAAFNEITGEKPEKMYGAELLFCRMFGLLKREKDGYRLTEKGAYLYHKIEQAYTAAYIDKSWNILRLQAFPDKIILK